MTYTLWLEGGYGEGWLPYECDTIAECYDHMRNYGHCGNYRITRDIKVEFHETKTSYQPLTEFEIQLLDNSGFTED